MICGARTSLFRCPRLAHPTDRSSEELSVERRLGPRFCRFANQVLVRSLPSRSKAGKPLRRNCGPAVAGITLRSNSNSFSDSSCAQILIWLSGFVRRSFVLLHRLGAVPHRPFAAGAAVAASEMSATAVSTLALLLTRPHRLL